MADVFVSYAREDRPFAARLAHALEAGGRTVWWDREILPGKDFAELIAAELAQAKAVVVIWSPASGKSGWVRDEAHEGLERGILVPVLVGVAEPPIGYRSIHAVDLTGWVGGEHPGLVDLGLAVDSLRTGVPVPDRPEIETDRGAAPAEVAALGDRGHPGNRRVRRRGAGAALADRVARQSRPAAGPDIRRDLGPEAVSRLPGLPRDDAGPGGAVHHGCLLSAAAAGSRSAMARTRRSCSVKLWWWLWRLLSVAIVALAWEIAGRGAGRRHGPVAAVGVAGGTLVHRHAGRTDGGGDPLDHLRLRHRADLEGDRGLHHGDAGDRAELVRRGAQRQPVPDPDVPLVPGRRAGSRWPR